MKTLALAVAALFLFACAPEKPDELAGEPGPDTFHLLDLRDSSFHGEEEQVRGFYSRGSMVNSSLLPAFGFGFVKIHRPRNRGYASFDMVEILKAVARELQEAAPSMDRMQIGDMSAAGGGRISGHASHQNGLDADVAYLRVNQTEQDHNDTSGFVEDFVSKGRLTANFDLRRNWLMAKLFVKTGRVQRLFVNEVVKKGLCAYVKDIGEAEEHHETLRRIRTIAGHSGHMHVRITCPANSPQCISQDEVPEGSGC